MISEHFVNRLNVDPSENRTIAELRVKLEIRSILLRASLAVNTALIAGLIVQIVVHIAK